MVMATSKEKVQASHQKSSSQDYWLFRFLFQQAKELFQSKPQTKEREKIQISAGSEGSIGLSQSGVRK
jgi:ABC-type transporter lipoprotein component MlaA